jgi:hypothetical protein
MNRPSNDTTITRPVAYSELTTTCACAPQDVETAPRAILLFKQMDYDGNGRLPLTDAEVLTALGVHCDRANITTNKPQYGFSVTAKPARGRHFSTKILWIEFWKKATFCRWFTLIPMARKWMSNLT